MTKSILFIGDDNNISFNIKEAYDDAINFSFANDYTVATELIKHTKFNLVVIFEDKLESSVYDFIYNVNVMINKLYYIVITNDITAEKIIFGNELGIYDVIHRNTKIEEIILSIDKALSTSDK